MARSAWQIWLHPVRSRSEIESLEEEVETLRAQLASAEEGRLSLKNELEQKTLRTDSIISRGDEERAQLNEQILRLEDEKSDLKAEILEWEQTRIELDAIAEQLKEWEKVKARYEEHIKMLSLRLRDARGRKGDFTAGHGGNSSMDSDIIEDGDTIFVRPPDAIDMLAAEVSGMNPRERNAPDSNAGEPQRPSAASSSAGSPTDRSRKRENSSVRNPGTRRRLPKDDSDWLMSLPPE